MASKAPAVSEARRIARTAQLELVAPECEKGIGVVVSKPDAAELIEGVCIAPVTLWPDDRGYFLEVQRYGRGLAEGFPAGTTQVSAASRYPLLDTTPLPRNIRYRSAIRRFLEPRP